MQRVLITDNAHPLLREGLEKAGYHCEDQPNISLEEVRTRVGDYVGLVINSKILIDRQMLDAGHQLRFIARLGSGLEIVDRDYAKEKGVEIISSPEGNRNAVAEHAVGMLLALANNLIPGDREVKQKIWRREAMRGWEIWGKTIGIIGFGNTGKSLASKLSGFGVRILAYDKYNPYFEDQFPNVNASSLKEIQKEADIISFHLPLHKEVYHLANEAFFNNCKDGVILINTSRGQVVNTLDLLEALRKGKVGGACLDVFENEKTASFSGFEDQLYGELYKRSDVILSPHVAGWTVESKEKLASILLNRILLTTE